MSGARIVTVDAGLAGPIAAFETRAATNGKAEVTVINDQDDSWFVPSNPWVAVKWREPDAIRVHLPTIMAKRGFGFTSAGAKRVHPGENRVELNDGSSVAYDYLVLATGPDLAFDEIAGLGPDGFTQSVCRTTMPPPPPPRRSTGSAKIPGQSWSVPRTPRTARSRPRTTCHSGSR